MKASGGIVIQTYLPLYRKYRPQQFSDLVGQTVVSNALSNALTQNHIVHAYLFCGPRGTGKTSSARILAKSLNCEKGPTITPCQTCPSCVSITQGSALDVTELDAASNNGVEDIRELLERVQFAPIEGRYKIYIIDEVHMLSASAFNALLKTLEEPPDNVIFIFATTEAHKVLPTIISRCQRFDFSRIDQASMTQRLAEIAQTESIHIQPEALDVIARHVKGGMRDALSLLDQVSVFGLAQPDQPITVEHLMAFLGSLSDERLYELTQTLIDQDPMALLSGLQSVIQDGTEPPQLVQGLIDYFRALLILHSCGGEPPELLQDRPAELLTRMAGQAQTFRIEELSQILHRLSTLSYQMKQQPHPMMWLEIGLLEILHRASISSFEEILKRLETLEHGGGSAIPRQGMNAAAPAQGRHTSRPTPVATSVSSPQAGAPKPLNTPTQNPPFATPKTPDHPAVEPMAPQPVAAMAVAQPVATQAQIQAPIEPTLPIQAPSPAALPTNNPGHGASTDLAQLWQHVVLNIQHPPTRGLVKDNCHILAVDLAQNTVHVGFSSEMFYNMFMKSADKQTYLTQAFAACLGQPVQAVWTISKGTASAAVPKTPISQNRPAVSSAPPPLAMAPTDLTPQSPPPYDDEPPRIPDGMIVSRSLQQPPPLTTELTPPVPQETIAASAVVSPTPLPPLPNDSISPVQIVPAETAVLYPDPSALQGSEPPNLTFAPEPPAAPLAPSSPTTLGTPPDGLASVGLESDIDYDPEDLEAAKQFAQDLLSAKPL